MRYAKPIKAANVIKVIVELAAALCTGVLLQSSQFQGPHTQSLQGSVSPSVSGAGESGLSESLSFSLSLRLDRSDILLSRLVRSRPLTFASRLWLSPTISASPPSYHSAYQNLNLFTIVFCLNSIHTFSITTAALVIRRQNGHCGLSTQQSLLILVDHTASSNQEFDYIVTKLNFLVSLTLLSLLVFGCVLRVLKTIQFYWQCLKFITRWYPNAV